MLSYYPLPKKNGGLDAEPYARSLAAILEIRRLADGVAAKLARPNNELAGGTLTPSGAAIQRRQIAQQALEQLDASSPASRAVQAARDEAVRERAAVDAAATTAAERFVGLDLHRAAATATWIVTQADSEARAKFAELVRAGDRDAVGAALALPKLHVLGAQLHEVARGRAAEQVVGRDRVRQARALEVALELCVEPLFAELREYLERMASNGLERELTARDLLNAANDPGRTKLQAEALSLGVIDAAPSTGTPPTLGRDASARDRMNAANAAAAGANARPTTGGAVTANGSSIA